jgi:hypothetical protein
MAHNPLCDSFPDIWQEVPADQHDPTYNDIVNANSLHAKVYKAARYVVVTDFNPGLAIPEEPEDFPGNPGVLTDAQIALMATVHGILVADNWEPTMGKLKPAPGSGDVLIDVGGGQKMVVDGRFIDAAVKAVQEYTVQSPLFNAVLLQLRAESVQPAAANPPPLPPRHQHTHKPANP